jgi:hypothetical protein
MKWSVLQLKKLVEIVQQIHQLVEHQKALENERVMVNFKPIAKKSKKRLACHSHIKEHSISAASFMREN